MMMGVLELLYVPYLREVLLVYVGLGLHRTEAFENSLVWLVYFHVLKLLFRCRSIKS